MCDVSAVLITLNAAEHLDRCLASLNWCREIVIVDSGSTDATLDIACRYTDKIHITSDWPGFGPQKNRALALAQCEWVLSIDADEAVPADLQTEILQTLMQPEHVAYRLPRLSRYCGRWMQHGDWYPDYVLRLFRRDAAHFSEDRVHERLLLATGSMGTLKQPLHHRPFDTLEQVLHKLNRYSSEGALMQQTKGKHSSLRKAVLHGLWAFIRTFLLKLGFLDGREGFILAVSNAEGTYYRYLKLMYLQESQRHHAD